MAKHAKQNGKEYVINVTELHHGFVAIEAESLDEAMSIARDIHADRKVAWAGMSVRFEPELS